MEQAKMSPKDLMTQTVAELRALARKNSVELKSSLKADIARELAKALKPKKAAAKKAVTKKAVTKKAVAKKAATKKAVTKKAVTKKAATKKAVTKKAATKKAATKKAATKKAATKKTAIKKTAIKKTATKKAVTKKAATKKAATKETPVNKLPAKSAQIKTESRAMAKTAAKQEQDQGAQRKAAPMAPASAKPRTSLPVGTVPPRAPKAPGSRSTEQKQVNNMTEKLGSWKPKTPEELSSNWVSAIPVEPGRLFVSWDIEKEKVKQGRRLVLRVMDITDALIREDDTQGSFIQVPIKSLSGGMFVSVSRDRSYRATIGTMGMGGDFQPVISTGAVTTPNGVPSKGQSLLEEEHFQFGMSRSKGAVSSY